MAKRNEVKLTWVAINPDSLPEAHRKAYDALKKQFDATKKAKQAFESLLIATVKGATSYPESHPLKAISDALKAGQSAKCSYLRGIAMAAAPAETDKASHGAASLVA